MSETLVNDARVMSKGQVTIPQNIREVLIKALQPPYQPVVCDYVIDELHRKFREKFPHKLTELEAFLFNVLSYIKVVSTPEKETIEESKVRDPKDRPILRAALNEHAELFLTGDKDFLESSIHDPRILSPAEFLKL